MGYLSQTSPLDKGEGVKASLDDLPHGLLCLLQ